MGHFASCPGHFTKYPPRFRKNITNQKIISIRGTVNKAMQKYISDSESTKRVHVELLYNDILLAHLHAFGDHSRCENNFCKSANAGKILWRVVFGLLPNYG